ncbi:MFS transporter [Lederbergia lenta]|uniref:Major facilitator superfamily protein n=1 Tax=Lederbergia lenta TaxID=1467 RepID=A0A2X4ZFD5_LEDLE|nr:MFS transporter [Lederbergia lenta]MCM3112214.1 MFS transporter [Lederbergia lenta]MEC2323382.1 MFS transporter [Lederbergia lenta]SQI63335.1 major facilitator superfamily protein [Lederbergia lenta]
MQKRLLFIFIMSTFVVGTVELIITGILELIAADLQVSKSLSGQLITIYAFSFAIGAPILAIKTAKLERKIVLLISLAIFIGGNILSALSPSYFMLAGVRIITALAAALFIVVVLSTAAKLAHPSKQGRILGLVYMGFSAANVFGVPFGTYIGSTFGWRSTFWLIATLSIICFILIALFLPKTEGATANEKMPFKALLKNREVVSLLSITTIWLAAHYVVYSYISPMMTDSGYSLATVSFILLLAGVAGTSGTAVGGSLSDLIGSKRTLWIAGSLFMIALLFLRLSLPYILLFSIVIFIWNFAQWSTNPAIQSALININPKNAELSLSLNMSALNIGIGLGALIGGIIIHNGGLHFAPFIAAAMTIIPLILIKKITSVAKSN